MTEGDLEESGMLLDNNVCVEFILNTAASYFGTSLNIDQLSSKSQEALRKFLNDTKCKCVLFSWNRRLDTITCCEKITKHPEGSEVWNIAFCKSRAVELTMDNFHDNVSFLTLQQPCAERKLFEFSEKIAASRSGASVEPLAHEQVNEPNDYLAKRLNGSSLENKNFTAPTLNTGQAIQSLTDEVNYWASCKGEDAERADYFCDTLKPLAERFERIRNAQFACASECLDKAQDTFEELWAQQAFQPFPQYRMENLLVIIENLVADYVDTRLKPIKFWSGHFKTVLLNLRSLVFICNRWQDACESMTGHVWKNIVTRRWAGESYGCPTLQRLSSLLEQMTFLRCAKEALSSVIDNKTSAELNELWSASEDFQYLHSHESVWKTLLEQTSSKFALLSNVLLPSLRESLLGHNEPNVFTTIQCFLKYKDLLCLSAVKREIKSERESLLLRLNDHLKRNQESFIRKVGSWNDDLLEACDGIIPFIVRVRHEEELTKSFLKNITCFIDDLDGFDSYEEKCCLYRNELKTYSDDLFERWCKTTSQTIDTNKNCLNLGRHCQVMELDRNQGTLHVNYSDSLLCLIKDVRLLLSLGYKIPHRIQGCARNAQKFLKYAVTLHQIAYFYNNYETDTLPYIQAMMFESACDFERIIDELTGRKTDHETGTSVTWDNVDELKSFVGKLKLASDKIASLYRKLLFFHQRIDEKMCKLKQLDLLHQQVQWKEVLDQIRTIFGQLETSGVRADDMKQWKVHWDSQLFKILEVHYQAGLKKLVDTLPPVKADLELLGDTVATNPSERELRKICETEMTRFINIPFHFKGFVTFSSEQQSSFKKIAANSGEWIKWARSDLESVFESLEKLKTNLNDWGYIMDSNLREVIKRDFKKATDWEQAFAEVKIKGQKLEHLPRVFKVGIIQVYTEHLKKAIDERLQRAYELSLSTLRASCLADCNEVNRVFLDVTRAFGDGPKTTKELTSALKERVVYVAKKEEMEHLLSNIENKHDLYKKIAGESLQQVEQSNEQVDRFKAIIEANEKGLQEQIDVFKRSLSNQMQDFNQEVNRLTVEWKELKCKEDGAENVDEAFMANAAKILNQMHQKLDELVLTSTALRQNAQSLGVAQPTFGALEELQQSFQSYEDVHFSYRQFHSQIEKMAAELWVTFRKKLHNFRDFLSDWGEKLESLKANPVVVQIDKSISHYITLLPLLSQCTGECYDSNHWNEFYRILGLPMSVPCEKLRLSHLFSVHSTLKREISKIKKLNIVAQKDSTIKETIDEIETWTTSCTFQFTPLELSNKEVMHLVLNWKDITLQIQDKNLLLETIAKSSSDTAFYDKSSFWQEKLATLSDRMNCLQEVQRRWVYLQPIFSRGVLSKEWPRFRAVDELFRNAMENLHRDSRITTLQSSAVSKIPFDWILEQLKLCQKALISYLEEKRSQFPRFYFIADDHLLELIGRADQPEVIQMHIQKLFPAVATICISKSGKSIVAIESVEGETVQLKSPVAMSGDLWIWLSKLEASIQETLKEALLAALNAIDKNVKLDPSKYPCQILCLAKQIHFCKECEQAILCGSLSLLLDQLKSQINAYRTVNLEAPALEWKLKALIMDLSHHIVVVGELVKSKISSLNDWLWQKQLRFYCTRENNVIAKLLNAEFEYSFEYVGNATKLVHTPLTDKCFLVFTQAMKLGLGGNPYGPTGTGKTETVKALGALLGRLVLVFNCDESADEKSMARLFVGLTQCGAWGCFDEFNRLEERVMSVISTEIESIQYALRNRCGSCKILDKEVVLNSFTALYITLNPAGKRYAGRQKLPENLKLLFRPVAMPSADAEMIARILLLSEGFNNADLIGGKLACLFKSLQGSLSQQNHYDWGLRAMKDVIKRSGDILRLKKLNSPSAKLTNSEEYSTLIKAVQSSLLSSLTQQDEIIFKSLLVQIFPSVQLEEKSERPINVADVELTQQQIFKVEQLYEQLQQRIGVIIVGPSGSGKTTIWKSVVKIMENIKSKVYTYHFNPKYMEKSQLFGYVNLDTQEWCDGFLTFVCRKTASEDLNSWTCIVCDGEIDPEWIESMNSVFDDNKLLTLSSGERVQFKNNVNFIFECESLGSASPATISRMGIVYLSDNHVDYKTILNSNICGTSSLDQKKLNECIQLYFEHCVSILSKRRKEFLVERNYCGSIVDTLCFSKGVQRKKELLFRLAIGLSTNLCRDSRCSFITQFFEMAKIRLPKADNPLDCTYSQSLDDFVTYDKNASSKSNDHSFDELVRTPTICAALQLLKVLMDHGCSTFIVAGLAATAKCLSIEQCSREIPSVQLCYLHCCEQTTVDHLVERLRAHTRISTLLNGQIWRPKDCERLIFYLRSINACKADQWGTSAVIAFVDQLVSYGGFYDSNFEWVKLVDVQIICGITLRGKRSFRDQLSAFASSVPVIGFNEPDESENGQICAQFLRTVLNDVGLLKESWLDEVMANAVKCMVELHSKVTVELQSDATMNYYYNSNDLMQWITNLKLYKTDFKNVEEFFKVWKYEAFRVYSDRLVRNEEKMKFNNIFKRLLEVHLPQHSNIASITKALHYTRLCENVVSAHLPGDDEGVKLSCVTGDVLKSFLTKVISSYYYEAPDTNVIVVVDEFLETTVKIDRALQSKTKNSLVLLGRSGCGRSTAIGLITSVYQWKIITLHVNSTYNFEHYKADVKRAIVEACVGNTLHLFLIEGYQMLSDDFYDILCSLITNGEVIGLFKKEEMESILSQLREKASQDSYQGSLHSYFVHRTKCRLKIVLLLDSGDPVFNMLIQRVPAFPDYCTTIAVHHWNDKSMEMIAGQLLISWNKDRSEEFNEQDANALAKMLPGAYEVLSAAEMERSPRRYLALVYQTWLIECQKRSSIMNRLKILKSGVTKLHEARSVTEKLSAIALSSSELLSKKQAEADSALKEIMSSITTANVQKENLESLKRKSEAEGKSLHAQKKVIEEKLNKIEPLIQQAKADVQAIRSESLSEIRSLRAPPETIRDILEAVLILMRVYDSSWASMRTFLAKTAFKEEFINFDAHQITPEALDKVSKLVHQKKTSFDLRNAKRASAAAAPLSTWVLANMKYAEIIVKIKPLEEKKDKLEKSTAAIVRQIESIRLGMQSTEDQAKVLREKFQTLTLEAGQIELNLAKENATVSTAKDLTNKLSSEYKRWQSQISCLSDQLNSIRALSIYISSHITFPMTTDSFANVPNQLQDLLKIESVNVVDSMSMEVDRLKWKREGLPEEKNSAENALAVLHSVQVPLIIDPSRRAIGWLLKHFQGSTSKVEFINDQDENWFTQLQLCIRFGKVMILEIFHRMNPVIHAVLKNWLSYKDGGRSILIGDKSIDCQEGFKLYLWTTRDDVTLSAYESCLVRKVNFSMTQSGFASILLSLTIDIVKPDLEQRKNEVFKQREETKLFLEKTEETILDKLASVQKNILDDEQLLNSLNNAKDNSEKLALALKEAEDLQSTLESERCAYFPIATSASSAYFAMLKLRNLNHMYRFSLRRYIEIYKSVIVAEKTEETGICWLEKCKNHLILDLIDRVGGCLAKKDHLLYALDLVRCVCSEYFPIQEWRCFIQMSNASAMAARMDDSPKGIIEQAKQRISLFKNSLPQLFASLSFNVESKWRPFMDSENYEQHLPENTTAFQKLLIVAALRPHNVITSVGRLLKAILKRSWRPKPKTFETLLLLSSAEEPILITTTSGDDPSLEIQQMAQYHVGQDCFVQLAMGKNDMASTLGHLKNCALEGKWLCLKNVHFATNHLHQLESDLKSMRLNKNFRLWLITEESFNYPPSFLELCLQHISEPPAGLKASLNRTWSSLNPSMLSKFPPHTFRAVVALCLFHAICQQRGMYIPQGWSQLYEFSYGDFKTAFDVTCAFLMNNLPDTIGWDFVRGVLGDFVYGGRIEDDIDKTIVKILLVKFFNSQLENVNAVVMTGLDPLPNDTTLMHIDDWIENIDEAKCLQVLGLPANAGKSLLLSQMQVFFKKLTLIDMAQPSSTFVTFKEVNQKLKPLLDLWKQLNQTKQVFLLKCPILIGDSKKQSPFELFSRSEHSFAVNLAALIHADLSRVYKLSQGVETVSQKSCDEIVMSFLRDQTPDKWLSILSGPLNPSIYISKLTWKALSLHNWLEECQVKSTFFHKPIAMSMLFRPEAFLNCLRQFTASKLSVCFDELTFQLACSNAVTTSYGCWVVGLQIEGASFNGMAVCALDAMSATISEMPRMYAAWTKKSETQRNVGELSVPVYSNSSRQHMLTYARLPALGQLETFVLNKVALFIGNE